MRYTITRLTPLERLTQAVTAAIGTLETATDDYPACARNQVTADELRDAFRAYRATVEGSSDPGGDEPRQCAYCRRPVVLEGGRWIDPEAPATPEEGGDYVWRETCDAHDTLEAEHDPDAFPTPDDDERTALWWDKSTEDRCGDPARVNCGACGHTWCETCDPAPGPLCHNCHGRGYSTAALDLD